MMKDRASDGKRSGLYGTAFPGTIFTVIAD
jgi:hypothetical protein